MTKYIPESKHGYPRELAPHAMHNLFDDQVKSASYIYQQLNLAVAGSSASLLLQASITKQIRGPHPSPSAKVSQKPNLGQFSSPQPLW
jgi:hypothetical protein